MRSDTTRQVVTVLTFLLTMTVNVAANALPMNGLRTAEISDRFHVYVIPAGYVFSIWGVIYLLLAAFTVWQALPRNRSDEVLRSLGWLPALSGLLNSAWVVLFQYELFALTVPVMLALLLTLIAIHLRLWAHRDRVRGTAFWVVRVPFSVYLGWITVATIANIAQAGAALGIGSPGETSAIIASGVLLVGLAIASRFVYRFRDAAYGLVIVWAYVGIVVKEQDTAIVALVAALGALLVAVLVVRAITLRHTAGPGAPIATGAAA
ncbi:MAG TPA: tryptophan-rich sensory protein [Candidatus Limnocylindrales bacterium]|nr:tryptophan-rich sensory protein [Candidatus Limnocylindrales bacterium]